MSIFDNILAAIKTVLESIKKFFDEIVAIVKGDDEAEKE